MDPSRKRAIRLTVALAAAVLLASALIYTSFSAGRDELTAGQLVRRAQPGRSYLLAGTVLNGSVRRQGNVLLFRIRDPKRATSVWVRYTGIVPDPFRAGRGVVVTVQEQSRPTPAFIGERALAAPLFIGQPNSLTTKCPSKYQAASSAT